MADPLTADRFLAALVAEGVRVQEHDGWRTHNRNHKGAWGPVHGVIVHHTVSSGSAATVRICRDGYSGLPGPLCQGVITKDGVFHLISSGRANHAGGGDPDTLAAVIAEEYGDRPPAPNVGNVDGVDGNARFYGWECENLGDGKDPWPAAQLETIERASAAVCRAFGWSAKSVIGHLEWSDDKNDPRGFTMPDMRRRVAARLARPAGSTPTTPPTSEEDDMPTADEIAKAVWAHTETPGSGKAVRAGAAVTWMDSVHAGQNAKLADIAAKVGAIQAGALTPEQITAIADKVASSPILAENIAKRVAADVAARMQS